MMNRTLNDNVIPKSEPDQQGGSRTVSRSAGSILTWAFVMLFSGTILFGFGATGLADEILRLGFGTMTSVEVDRTVIIDERGYSVDSSARITNSYGQRVRLKDLALPAEVKFEYAAGPKGPVIKSLSVPGK